MKAALAYRLAPAALLIAVLACKNAALAYEPAEAAPEPELATANAALACINAALDCKKAALVLFADANTVMPAPDNVVISTFDPFSNMESNVIMLPTTL